MTVIELPSKTPVKLFINFEFSINPVGRVSINELLNIYLMSTRLGWLFKNYPEIYIFPLFLNILFTDVNGHPINAFSPIDKEGISWNILSAIDTTPFANKFDPIDSNLS